MSSIDHGYRIGLSKGNGPISRLIKRETRSEYSHGYLLTPNKFVVESVAWDGMRVRKWSPSEIETVDFFDVSDRSLQTWEEIEETMREWVKQGIRYDYRSIVRWMVKLPMHKNGKVFCTEALELAGQMAGDPLFRSEPQYISPRDHSIIIRLFPRPPKS